MGDSTAQLTPTQGQALEEFRQKINDALPPEQLNDDLYLLRWLRARGYDLIKSEDMLRKSLHWREKWGADTILQDFRPPEVLRRYYSGGICGYDKEGYPIYVEPVGGLDMKGMVLSAKKTDILKYNIWILENIYQEFLRQTQRLGKRIDKITMIVDLEGFGMKELLQPGMDLILKVMAFEEANYPETLKVCFVINAPRVFPMIWKVVKPFLSEDTQRKVIILGKDWRERLLDHIEADQLPEHWGGTRTGPNKDPFCRPMVNMGGVIPQSFYLKGSNLVDADKVSKATIRAGNAYQAEYEVYKEGQILKWIFWTESNDISFSINYRNAKGVTEVVRKGVRVECETVPEDGCMECDKTGTYIIKFDNSYSWMNSKVVYYHVEVITKDTSQTCDGDIPHDASSGSTGFADSGDEGDYADAHREESPKHGMNGGIPSATNSY